MRKFYDSSTFRRHEHDRISTALAGGHDDDTSCCSLSVDCRTPNFQVREGGNPRMARLYMYYGKDLQYEVKKVSDIRANDYVFAHRTNSSHDQVDMIAIYEACSRALDDGMFVFQPGEFDCGNKYLEAANLYDPDKPWIKPDRLFPYYFRSTSPIRGRVTWDEMNDGDFGLRHVFVVNTDLDEDLAAKIPDGAIIYIGGDHSREQLGFSPQYQQGSVDWDLTLKMDTSRKRFSSWSCSQYDLQKGQDDCRAVYAQPSSSFSNCCSTRKHVRLNTISFLSYEGCRVYWPTTAKGINVSGVSPAPLCEIGLFVFEVDAGFNKRDSVSLEENITIDARVMKGFYVKADELDGKLVPTVLKEFGGGVVHLCGDDLNLNSRLMSWLMKLLSSSELMNTSGESPRSVYCSEESSLYGRKLIIVAKVKLAAVAVSAAEGASLLCEAFKTLITYSAGDSAGIIQIGDQAPGGEETIAIIYNTSNGLLPGWNVFYRTVHTGNGTSYLGGADHKFVRVLELGPRGASCESAFLGEEKSNEYFGPGFTGTDEHASVPKGSTRIIRFTSRRL